MCVAFPNAIISIPDTSEGSIPKHKFPKLAYMIRRFASNT